MTKRNSSTRAKEGRWFSLLQMLHRCLSLRYVSGDHHVSWLLLAWSPFSSQPVNGLLLYSKASKAYRAAIPQIFLFFSSSSSFTSVLLCFHSQHLLVRCFLSIVLCIFSASRNRKVGGMMPFYFPGVQQTTVNNVCCVLQHSRSRQASYSSRDVRCSYPYFLLPLPFPLD